MTIETATDAATSAVRVQAADAAVRITGPARVTEWARRYFTPWWAVDDAALGEAADLPVVAATVDPDRYADLADRITATSHREVTYARAPLLLVPELDGAIGAVSAGDRLAYRSAPEDGLLEIVGCDTEATATATARLAREVIRGQLVREGWAVLHAAAVARDDEVVLVCGGKGAGKTTTALTAATRGWSLLANDRVFIRADLTGRVRVLPWPAAAAIGLGLLDALGWLDTTRRRLMGGEPLHPTQDPRITTALRAGWREPLWDGHRELKAQFFADQLTDWFGLNLAHGGEAAALLFPTVSPSASSSQAAYPARGLADADFMSGSAEDRYPDVFELIRAPAGGRAASRTRVGDAMRALPHHALTLTHAPAANAVFLGSLLANIRPRPNRTNLMKEGSR